MLIALGIATLTFTASSEALFAVTISAGFAVMFFAVPWIMLGVRVRRDKRWMRSEAVRSAPVVATLTGRIRRGGSAGTDGDRTNRCGDRLLRLRPDLDFRKAMSVP